VKLNSEDAKARRPEEGNEAIWKAGNQEKPRLLPVFLLSKFKVSAASASSRLRC
jgi:hypothetical protein